MTTIGVYGASGFQGRLVLAELVRRGIDAVPAGRDPVRLAEAAAAAGLPDSPPRTAALDDHDALVAALRGCDAVVNCAGPFTPSGAAVVAAALAAGSHYVDTSGEQPYIKGLFDTFGEAARTAGVTVVPAATDAVLPTDLLGHLVAERVAPVLEITSTHVLRRADAMSRGSLRTLMGMTEALRTGRVFTRYADGAWHTDAPSGPVGVVLPGAAEPVEANWFPLGEVVTVPRHVPARRMTGLLEASLAVRLSTLLTPELIDSLPEGPTQEARRAQSFTYVLDAVGEDGRRARGVVRGADTYGTTAVVAVEAANRLAAGGTGPGVLAAAEAYEPADFLDFLRGHGVEWRVEDA